MFLDIQIILKGDINGKYLFLDSERRTPRYGIPDKLIRLKDIIIIKCTSVLNRSSSKPWFLC